MFSLIGFFSNRRGFRLGSGLVLLPVSQAILRPTLVCGGLALLAAAGFAWTGYLSALFAEGCGVFVFHDAKHFFTDFIDPWMDAHVLSCTAEHPSQLYPSLNETQMSSPSFSSSDHISFTRSSDS